MSDLDQAIARANAEHSADTQSALYASVQDQLREIEAELLQKRANIERLRDAIRAEQAASAALRKDARLLRARKRVYARAAFALQQIDEEV